MIKYLIYGWENNYWFFFPRKNLFDDTLIGLWLFTRYGLMERKFRIHNDEWGLLGRLWMTFVHDLLDAI